jgi:hypothetical protein
VQRQKATASFGDLEEEERGRRERGELRQTSGRKEGEEEDEEE